MTNRIKWPYEGILLELPRMKKTVNVTVEWPARLTQYTVTIVSSVEQQLHRAVAEQTLSSDSVTLTLSHTILT